MTDQKPEPELFTPERAQGVVDSHSQAWQQDWGLIVQGLMDTLHLSRLEVLLYELLMIQGPIMEGYAIRHDEYKKDRQKYDELMARQAKIFAYVEREMRDDDTWREPPA